MTESKLNLGSGTDYKTNWVNVDYFNKFNPDICFDLNKLPYPFKDNTFDEVLMKHIIEHLDKPAEVLKEINRICKSNAIIQINTPHFSSNNAWGDIEHKRPFNYSCFTNYCNNYGGFEIIKQKITFSHWKFFMRPIVKLIPQFYEKHLAYIFTAVDLRTTLKVIK
jgi:ubiquinone/menaquinone biosynthesis C-methylase UbiE